LRSPQPDTGLTELFALAERVADAPLLQAEAARLAVAELRARFPASTPDIRELTTAADVQFVVDVSDSFAAKAYAGWLDEGDDFAGFMSLIEPGDVVVDVGANFGIYALHAARRTGPDGSVVAYEPAPHAFDLLRQSIARNGLEKQVVARQAAVAAGVGKAQFFVTADVSFSGLSDTNRSAQQETVEVDLVSLDAEPALAERAAALLKIDVEGHEGGVLKGAVALMSRSPRLIVQFEYSHKNATADLDASLADGLKAWTGAGFGLFKRDEGGLAEMQRAPSKADGFSGNLFLARKGESERRLREAMTLSAAPLQAKDGAAARLLREVATLRRREEHVESLEHTIKEITQDILGESIAGSALDRVRALQTFALSRRAELAQSNAQVAALTTSVAAYESMIEGLKAKIESLRGAIERFENRVKGLETDRDTLTQKATALREALTKREALLDVIYRRVGPARFLLPPRDGT
jgi:FkbM family methyltransferase